MILKNDEKLDDELTWGIWQILTRALKILKNFYFNKFPLSKVYNFWERKLQRTYL